MDFFRCHYIPSDTHGTSGITAYTRCFRRMDRFLLTDLVEQATVSERLGHYSVRVTADIYSHAMRGSGQEAAGRGTISCVCTVDRARNPAGKPI